MVAYARRALTECLCILETLGSWACNIIARVCLKHLVELEMSLPMCTVNEADKTAERLEQKELSHATSLSRMLLRMTITSLVASQKIFTDYYDR